MTLIRKTYRWQNHLPQRTPSHPSKPKTGAGGPGRAKRVGGGGLGQTHAKLGYFGMNREGVGGAAQSAAIAGIPPQPGENGPIWGPRNRRDRTSSPRSGERKNLTADQHG